MLSLHIFYGYALCNLAIQATETNKCDLIWFEHYRLLVIGLPSLLSALGCWYPKHKKIITVLNHLVMFVFCTFLTFRCHQLGRTLSSGEKTEVERPRVGLPVDYTVSCSVLSYGQRTRSSFVNVLSHNANSFERTPWRLVCFICLSLCVRAVWSLMYLLLSSLSLDMLSLCYAFIHCVTRHAIGWIFVIPCHKHVARWLSG